jgi:hypothetical protein
MHGAAWFRDTSGRVTARDGTIAIANTHLPREAFWSVRAAAIDIGFRAVTDAVVVIRWWRRHVNVGRHGAIFGCVVELSRVG